MAAKITRTRKEVLFPSEDHLPMPRTAVALLFQKLAKPDPCSNDLAQRHRDAEDDGRMGVWKPLKRLTAG